VVHRELCEVISTAAGGIVGPAAAIDLWLTGPPTGTLTANLRHYRLNSAQSNACETWKRYGSIATPTSEQHWELDTAGQLAEYSSCKIHQGADGPLPFTLPRQADSLLILECCRSIEPTSAKYDHTAHSSFAT
jgi:hypothetical protein